MIRCDHMVLHAVQPALPCIEHLVSGFAHMVQPGLPHFAQDAVVVAHELNRMAPSAMGTRNSVFMMFA